MEWIEDGVQSGCEPVGIYTSCRRTDNMHVAHIADLLQA